MAIYGALAEGIPVHRIHGDCHLGNLLHGRDGWFFLDFDDLDTNYGVDTTLRPSSSDTIRAQFLTSSTQYPDEVAIDVGQAAGVAMPSWTEAGEVLEALASEIGEYQGMNEETIGLLGRNGEGKSTLLRQIVGLDETSGLPLDANRRADRRWQPRDSGGEAYRFYDAAGQIRYDGAVQSSVRGGEQVKLNRDLFCRR